MTPQEIKDMQETWGQFKATNEQALKEMKDLGTVTAETKTKLSAIETDLEKKETAINTRMDKVEADQKAKDAAFELRIKELEGMLARRGSHGNAYADQDAEKKAVMVEKRRVFCKALASGFAPSAIKDHLTADEFKLLQLGSDVQGGYLAPHEYVNEILKDVVQYSPIRTVARIRSTTRPVVSFPKRTQTAAAAWVSETGNRAETQTPTFGMENIPTHEMYGMAKATRQDLEDSVFDLQAFLQAEMSEQFGVTEGAAFVNGTSVGQPEGIMTNSSIGTVNTGVAADITADSLIDLYYEPKEQYLNTSTWCMNRSTMKTVRKLKDGEGNYLWAPGIRTDARPATLLDRPYIIAPDMPSIGASTYPIIFGDFGRGYIIIDRLDLEFMADPYTSKASGMIEFSARRRVGAQVIIAEALKKLRCHT